MRHNKYNIDVAATIHRHSDRICPSLSQRQNTFPFIWRAPPHRSLNYVMIWKRFIFVYPRKARSSTTRHRINKSPIKFGCGSIRIWDAFPCKRDSNVVEYLVNWSLYELLHTFVHRAFVFITRHIYKNINLIVRPVITDNYAVINHDTLSYYWDGRYTI